MKQAIIDIGSNSMRLTLYEIKINNFKVLFREKIMAGLAGYVEDGILSEEGIECAYMGLLDFRNTLDSLNIKNVTVFATASLRNIKNTEQAITAIRVATGFQVEIITGEEEALLGYAGAMQEVCITSGTFVDIGGASTELVSFDKGAATSITSFAIGSLTLYRECVKNVLPGEGSIKRVKNEITKHITKDALLSYQKTQNLICVGGTCRAVLKITRKMHSLPAGCTTISSEQLIETMHTLCEGGRDAIDMILRNEPDRIHTMIPGAMILRHIVTSLDIESITVSKYGVREGYLCQRILTNNQIGMPILKTEN